MTTRRGYIIYYIFFCFDIILTYSITSNILLTFIIGACLYTYLNFISEIILKKTYHTENINNIQNLTNRNMAKSSFEATKILLKDLHLPKVNIYYINSQDINALTLGKHSIAVTQGLLEICNCGEYNYQSSTLISILSHEFGHIYNGDILGENILLINMLFVILFVALINIVLIGSIWFIIVLLSLIGLCKFGLGGILFGRILTRFSNIVSHCIQNILLIVTHIIARFIGRHNEFNADLFALKLHIQNGLYLKQFLSRFDYNINTGSFRDILYSTHPSNTSRIQKIEKYMNIHYESYQSNKT